MNTLPFYVGVPGAGIIPGQAGHVPGGIYVKQFPQDPVINDEIIPADRIFTPSYSGPNLVLGYALLADGSNPLDIIIDADGGVRHAPEGFHFRYNDDLEDGAGVTSNFVVAAYVDANGWSLPFPYDMSKKVYEVWTSINGVDPIETGYRQFYKTVRPPSGLFSSGILGSIADVTKNIIKPIEQAVSDPTKLNIGQIGGLISGGTGLVLKDAISNPADRGTLLKVGTAVAAAAGGNPAPAAALALSAAAAAGKGNPLSGAPGPLGAPPARAALLPAPAAAAASPAPGLLAALAAFWWLI